MDISNISSMSIDGTQSGLALKVGVAVTKLAMDSTKQKSSDLVSMMERSVNPNIGKNIDVKV